MRRNRNGMRQMAINLPSELLLNESVAWYWSLNVITSSANSIVRTAHGFLYNLPDYSTPPLLPLRRRAWARDKYQLTFSAITNCFKDRDWSVVTSSFDFLFAGFNIILCHDTIGRNLAVANRDYGLTIRYAKDERNWIWQIVRMTKDLLRSSRREWENLLHNDSRPKIDCMHPTHHGIASYSALDSSSVVCRRHIDHRIYSVEWNEINEMKTSTNERDNARGGGGEREMWKMRLQ